ncbi:MAG TPA: DNA-processing protein DprA [Kofleriaceae bacterium]|nr:DNA-processing protein DprA [Kofleriaceae bacterium]
MTTALSSLRPGDAGYPQRLRALGIEQVLHVRGQLCEGPAVAIVGARAATTKAMGRAHTWAKHVVARGVQVVSGGALGIDAAAHRGALAGAGTTTVVLGSGVDVLYPARHAGLFHQILASDGALVSTFPHGMQPRPGTFTQRNTIISALADAVIVVEADVKSGSLSTAAAARKQGRIVAAYPGSPGCAKLLATGAALVETDEDVVELLAGRPRYPAPLVLDDNATRVRDALAQGVRGVDAIVRHTGLSVRAVLRALPQLESLARLQ